MAITDTLLESPPVGADVAGRLQQLEAFAAQMSGAVDQLVGAVIEVQQATFAQALAAELESVKAKLREVEQTLSLERANRELAQVSRMHAKRRVVVFVGTTYFGCNVKYAWAATQQRAQALDLQVWFLPFNAEQEGLVTALGGQCLPTGHVNWAPEHLHVALSAAVVVTSDHLLNPNPYAAALLAGARQVQLWHGVSIKEIGLRNLPPGRALGPHLARVLGTCGSYARMLGTAAAGEAEWRRWFAFERYAPIGYPRNDVLYREPTESDLAGSDRPTYERALATLARGKRVILYAPTFRDGRPEWVLQAGLDKLAQAAAQGGDLLVVNLHPVESPQIPKLASHLPGVVFVQPRTDLYPLLGKASALITDYSSVMFDYLHVGGAVLLFRPDHQAYTQKSRKLFDDKLSVLPGPLFEDVADLARAVHRADLGQTDAHRQARARLLQQWFDHHDGRSGERVAALVAEEIGLAGAQDSNRMRMVATAGSGFGIDACSPGVGVSRVVGQTGERGAQAMVARPAERHGLGLARRIGHRRYAGLGGELRITAEALTHAAQLGQDLRGADAPGTREAHQDAAILGGRDVVFDATGQQANLLDHVGPRCEPDCGRVRPWPPSPIRRRRSVGAWCRRASKSSATAPAGVEIFIDRGVYERAGPLPSANPGARSAEGSSVSTTLLPLRPRLPVLPDAPRGTALTYGTFDLFHVGHIRLFRRIKEHYGFLIVAVSTDAFNAAKGKRSVVSFDDRIETVRACRYVDLAIAEHDWAQKEYDVRQYGAAAFVMGDDWCGKFDHLGALCKVIYLPRTAGVSSSELKASVVSGADC